MTVPRDEAGFSAIRDWLHRTCGLDFPAEKAGLLRQRLHRVQQRYGIPDLDHLAAELRPGGRHEVQLAIMDEASIHHTYFFRETEVLDRFMEAALPSLRDRPEIRIWSAACASGEEVYSIAILLAERLSADVLKRLSLLGTDISAPVVDRAELGLYPARQLAQMVPARVARWFTPSGIDQHRVKPELRSACTFRRMNLKATPYPFTRPFQAVFCRNVLYYFDRGVQAETLRALYDMVEPGGWLVTSVTESIRHLDSPWQPVSTGLYRRMS